MKQAITYRNIARIAGPIVISGVAQNLINVTDTAFLGHYSEVALGAAGNGGILYFMCVLAAMGLSTGAQIIIGRRNGEGNLTAIGLLITQVLYLVLALSVIIFLAVHYGSPALLNLIVKSEAISEAAQGYLHYRSYGIFFSAINMVLIAFYVGTTRTMILIPATVFTAVVNIALDYGLIFGHWGMPELGVEGAAIASTVAEGATTLLLLGSVIAFTPLRTYNLFQFSWPNKSILVRILDIGAPMMMQHIMAMTAWFAFFSIIEHLGERELAISHIVRSIYMVMMIPLFGLSQATNSLVSNLIGQGDHDQVMPLIWRVLVIALLSSLIFLPGNLFFPEAIIGTFTEKEELIQLAVPCLRMVTASMFVFSFAFIFFSGVSGSGNTRTSMLIEAISIGIYLIYASTIVFGLGVSVQVAWSSEFVYFGAMALLSFLYMRSGRWKLRQV